MSHLNKPRISRIPVRPHTVAGAQGDESPKKEIEVQFTNQSMVESVTDVNDAFATGDAVETDEGLKNPEPVNQDPVQKKIPLFKQSMINCSLIESRLTKPLTAPKKYVPNYKKELGHHPVSITKGHVAPKKRISIPDELKSLGDEPFPECGLADEITEVIQKQLDELKRDTDENNVTDLKRNCDVLIDADRIKEIEARVMDLEQKFESLIELLYESQILKGPQLEIKLEEYNLEKLNSRLGAHKCDGKSLQPQVKQSNSQVISDDSDPNIYKEILYESRQKKLNLSLEGKSEESLKFNKIPVLERTGPVLEPSQPKYMSIFKQIGKFSRGVGNGN